MEEQNQDETIITKQDLEDWLTELEEVETHIKNLKQNFPTKRD